MVKILPPSYELNFSPKTLGCYGLRNLSIISVKSQNWNDLKCRRVGTEGLACGKVASATFAKTFQWESVVAPVQCVRVSRFRLSGPKSFCKLEIDAEPRAKHRSRNNSRQQRYTYEGLPLKLVTHTKEALQHLVLSTSKVPINIL